ncbi:hypothetical protein ACFP8W_22330, partial [Nocardioides hankookensis]
HLWNWTGLDEHGDPVAEGRYDLAISATQVARPRHTASSGWIGAWILDRTPPAAPTSEATRTTVYPTTTLFTDEARFEFSKDVPVASLDATVLRTDGTLVRTLEPKSMPCDYDYDHGFDGFECALVRWDGRDAAGVVQPAGSYVLHAVSSDAAGNRAVQETALTVSGEPLVEHTTTTTLPTGQLGAGTNACSYPPTPQICLTHGPVASDRFPGGWSYRSEGSGTAQSVNAVYGETGHEQFRVTVTGGPTTPGDPDTAMLSGTQMQGDGSFMSGWIPITMSDLRLKAYGAWSVTTQGGNDYDTESVTIEQTYFAPAS